VANRAVADDIDECGFARLQCPLERRTEFFRSLNVLAMTIHKLEHAVVALVRLDLERIGPAFEEGHFFETWSSGEEPNAYRRERLRVERSTRAASMKRR
jgi:hypothetical protein